MKTRLISPKIFDSRHANDLGCFPVMVGRSSHAAVRLNDPSVSRCHCEIDDIEGTLVVRDLGSKNGTFVNGLCVTAAPLMPRDMLTVGSTSFVMEYRHGDNSQNDSNDHSPMTRVPAHETLPSPDVWYIPGTSVPFAGCCAGTLTADENPLALISSRSEPLQQ
jgi:hypothetical protein